MYTTFMQISEHYGFGQNIGDLSLDNAVAAIKIEMIGQTFAVLGQLLLSSMRQSLDSR